MKAPVAQRQPLGEFSPNQRSRKKTWRRRFRNDVHVHSAMVQSSYSSDEKASPNVSIMSGMDFALVELPNVAIFEKVRKPVSTAVSQFDSGLNKEFLGQNCKNALYTML
jgi:hypothetical protein